jgi:hypothetical protein
VARIQVQLELAYVPDTSLGHHSFRLFLKYGVRIFLLS